MLQRMLNRNVAFLSVLCYIIAGSALLSPRWRVSRALAQRSSAQMTATACCSPPDACRYRVPRRIATSSLGKPDKKRCEGK
jgi:hypothetical protein